MTPEQIFYGSVVVIMLIVANLIMLIYLMSQVRNNRNDDILNAKDEEITRLNKELEIKQSTIERNLRSFSEQSKRRNV